jgi:hypothetical protein
LDSANLSFDIIRPKYLYLADEAIIFFLEGGRNWLVVQIIFLGQVTWMLEGNR